MVVIHHGTMNAYNHHRCRCDLCKTFMRDFVRARRARLKAERTGEARTRAAEDDAKRRAKTPSISDLPLPKPIPAAPAFRPSQTAHYHTWRIEEPKGPTSRAVCKGCGQEKTMHNIHILDRLTGKDLRKALITTNPKNRRTKALPSS